MIQEKLVKDIIRSVRYNTKGADKEKDALLFDIKMTVAEREVNKMIDKFCSERQTSTEVSENHDSKSLHIADVSKRFQYRFKAMRSSGGYTTSIIEANSREEAIKEIKKQYSEVIWVSERF